jgi:hypothetical protein
MIKRLLLPGYLVLFLSLCLFAVKGYAQDTTQKAPEIKSNPIKNPVVKSAIPPKIKRPYHYYNKVNPAAVPATTVDPNAAANTNATPEVDPTQLNDKSLNGQYQYLLSKTYRYQQPLIAALWKNVIDTLKLERNKLTEIQGKLVAENKKAVGIQSDLNRKIQESEPAPNADMISMFGIELPKATCNLIMFGLVAGLIIAFVIVIIATAKYKHEARYRINLYEEIEEEYKSFKAKANEKEKKLARELQTERNKLDELLGRG